MFGVCLHRRDHSTSSVLQAWLGSWRTRSLVCTHPHVDLRRHCLPNQQSPGLAPRAGPHGAALRPVLLASHNQRPRHAHHLARAVL